ncbi:MAG: proton/sodium-translocating pyrophosphatase, partial [Promethearchaeota archaeon]
MAVPIIIIIALIAGAISIIMAILFAKQVLKEDPGNERMQEIAGYIAEGAETYLKVQYKVLGSIVILMAIIICFALPSPLEGSPTYERLFKGAVNWEQAIAYLIGALGSMFAGAMGMLVGVKSNSRAAQACSIDGKKGFNIAFLGGSVMGLAVVGVALIGVSVLYMIVPDPNIVLGFSFGASSVALFMKCGGGIYTKTADVGADLVGKAEFDLPEDDPRNPATIADNVGDNVGDIAGMGSDLFDSYVASIVAAMMLAASLIIFESPIENLTISENARAILVISPILLCSAGLFASLIGIYFVKIKGSKEPGKALNTGTYMATLIFTGFAALITLIMSIGLKSAEVIYIWRLYITVLIGLASGLMIGFTSDYFTRDDKGPTQKMARSAEEGHAIVILSGFAYGLISVVPPAIGIVAAMAVSYFLGGIFGVAMAAVGMLAIVGTIVSNDAYGPIVDNARGLAEQGELGEEVIRTADRLDSAGNTAKAITKGYAIGAANLTVLALLFSFATEANEKTGKEIISVIDLLEPSILIGAFIG